MYVYLRSSREVKGGPRLSFRAYLATKVCKLQNCQPRQKNWPNPRQDRPTTDPPDETDVCPAGSVKRLPPMPNWRPSARIEKPYDHQETKSPSVKAHIDARDEPSSAGAAPARLAATFIPWRANSPTAPRKACHTSTTYHYINI